jgi:GNAT superfamily N-acetyltransferase
LDTIYFNHYPYTAQNWWERWRFIANWWRIYADDPYWVPPYYPALRRALEPDNRHLARLNPVPIYIEALPRRRNRSRSALASPAFEQSVAAAVVLTDPRRQDGAAYLALLQLINDVETLERLLEYLAEPLLHRGYHRIIGPTGLSPHLGTGLLHDYWSILPPLYTPYNPPYLPEIADIVLHRRSHSRLYHLDIPPELPGGGDSQIKLTPLEPARLANDLLPLFVEACPSWLNFAPPDSEEATFLLRWLGNWPLFGWLAHVESQPVGFVLLQPDISPLLRRARGGRNPLWRPWLAWASRRSVRYGRVLYLAVLSDWRKRGIGSQLWRRAMLTAKEQGWQSLSIGPLPGTAPGVKFLENRGAQPRQTYFLYQKDL